jgi:hypothetical protein
MKEYVVLPKNKNGRIALFAEIQANHRKKFRNDYFLVTFDEDKNSSFERQYMESEFVDQDHHIAHNKNTGCRTAEEPDVYEQWSDILEKVENDSNKKVVIKEVCVVI